MSSSSSMNSVIPERIYFTLLNNDGETSVIKVNPGDSVESLILKIREQSGILFDQQAFTCFDKRTLLKDDFGQQEILNDIQQLREETEEIIEAIESIPVLVPVDDDYILENEFDAPEIISDNDEMRSHDSSDEEAESDHDAEYVCRRPLQLKSYAKIPPTNWKFIDETDINAGIEVNIENMDKKIFEFGGRYTSSGRNGFVFLCKICHDYRQNKKLRNLGKIFLYRDDEGTFVAITGCHNKICFPKEVLDSLKI